MLFHSREFLFVFLPLLFAGWLGLLGWGKCRLAVAWLTIGSLVFYGYWNPPYLFLLGGSILFNFFFGKLVDPALGRPGKLRFLLLSAGVATNLGLLAYFKYANFFVDTINQVLGAGWTFDKVLLPLAISFFTFQQVAYLVDSYRGLARGHSFLDYAFFVAFFPQLIAGPIVHHSEVLPQIRSRILLRAVPLNLLVGLSIFVLGLFKKVVLADSCGELATPFFAASADGKLFATADAWCGVIAYSFQIYFDFSGYSDMAIGLARIFGIRLPENFAAPYRATSIVEFWRRWHITLSRFLKDYLYIPLGGNRRGILVRYRNLLITMLLGGLWHGAGWTFVIWGGLHGLYLTINHCWSTFTTKRGWSGSGFFPKLLSNASGWAITMLAVLIAWVFFRAESLESALSILKTLASVDAPHHSAGLHALGDFWQSPLRWPLLLLLALITILLPTTQSYFRNFQPVLEPQSTTDRWWSWRPGFVHGIALGLLLLTVVKKYFSLAPTEFLYFNF